MSARLLLGHARTRGSGAHNPRLGGGAPVPPPSFHFLRQRSQDRHALHGAVQVLARRPQISLGHYAVTHDAAWLRWITEKSSPIRMPSADSHIQRQRILKSRIPPGSVGRRMDRTREHRRSGCSISVEGAGPRFEPAKTARRRRSRRGADRDGPGPSILVAVEGIRINRPRRSRTDT